MTRPVPPASFVFVYVTAIAASEIAAAFAEPIISLAILAALTFVMVNELMGLSAGEDPAMPASLLLRTLAVLLLLPGARILSMAAAVKHVPDVARIALMGGPILLAVILSTRSPASGVAPTRVRLQVLLGCLGLPAALVIHLFARTNTPIEVSGALRIAGGALVLFVFSGVAEELLYRRSIQPVLCEWFGDRGVLVTTALNVAATLGTRSVTAVLVSALAGLGLGAWCRRSGSVVGPAVFHGLLSAGIILVLPSLGSS